MNMGVIISFVFGILLGAMVVYIFICKRSVASGIASHAQKQHDQKQDRKEKILSILRGKEGVANNEIEKTLGVTDTTATNYLQELEREGKIEQVGERGRFVSYRLKK